MRRDLRAAALVLLAACLLACIPASAAPLPLAFAALSGARPNPLGPLRSWQEAWAALSPFVAPTTAGVLCNSTAGPTVAAVCGEAAIKSLWTQWKRRYGLRYTGAVETLRYGYFRNTVRALVLKLSTCPRTLWVGLNYRADWSPNELRLNRKLFVPPSKPPMPINNVPLPTMWDWRRSTLDKVTPAKDQGRCGSAFAFAAVAAIESKLLIQYNRTSRSYPIDLSEQQVVDCVKPGPGSRYRSQGCEGGSLEEPLDFAARRFLVKEALYPYTSGLTNSSGACNTARTANVSADDKVQLTGSGYRQVQQWSAKALREAVRVAPVMVGFYVPEDSLFEFFSGGVWPNDSCVLPPGRPSNAQALVNHALLVVGYDMTVPGNHHWIVKNSFGRG
jgi:cathepsin L